MRKIFIVILASIIAVSGVYAGTSGSGSTNDSSGWTGGSPSVNLKFAIDGDTTALYNIGFSDAPGIPEGGRTSGDITLDFNADEICFRMELGHLGNEIPLARAELYPQGLVRIFEQLPPFSFMFFTMFQVDERSVIQNGLVNPRFSP